MIDRSRIHVGTVVALGGYALRIQFGLKLTGRILKIMVRRDFGLVIFGNRNLNFIFVAALLAMGGGMSYNSRRFARQRVKRQITRVVR